ncbi:hypothetical protein HAX54_032471, partial [Datura stramonium]|nr:hypothetical protein [Datura stramonium]
RRASLTYNASTTCIKHNRASATRKLFGKESAEPFFIIVSHRLSSVSHSSLEMNQSEQSNNHQKIHWQKNQLSHFSSSANVPLRPATTHLKESAEPFSIIVGHHFSPARRSNIQSGFEVKFNLIHRRGIQTANTTTTVVRISCM